MFLPLVFPLALARVSPPARSAIAPYVYRVVADSDRNAYPELRLALFQSQFAFVVWSDPRCTEVKILVAVVHNNEEDIPAHRVVEELRKIEAGIHHFNVSDQQLDDSVDLLTLARFAINQYRIERRWREYRQRSSVLQDIASANDTLLWMMRLVVSKKHYLKARTIRQIEIAVNQKHLDAWEQFKESAFDFLLVMESDATWVNSQSSRLARTIESLTLDTPLYINIGGGFDPQALEIESLIAQREGEGGEVVLTFSKPVTNTACAYILNRPLVQILLDSAVDASTRAWRQLEPPRDYRRLHFVRTWSHGEIPNTSI